MTYVHIYVYIKTPIDITCIYLGIKEIYFIF